MWGLPALSRASDGNWPASPSGSSAAGASTVVTVQVWSGLRVAYFRLRVAPSWKAMRAMFAPVRASELPPPAAVATSSNAQVDGPFCWA